MAESKIALQLNLDQLRCSMCDQYLSCAPIHVTPDGKKICGRCSENVSEEDCYREFALENILSNVEFPCKYKNIGCSATWAFGPGEDHESTCRFEPLLCAFSRISDCNWKHPVEQCSEHFSEAHSSLVSQDAKFHIDINSDNQNERVVSMDGIFFFIKYVYDCKTYTLRYSVAHFMRNVVNTFCKIQIASISDPECLIQLKGGECVGYASLFKLKNEFVLNLKDYFDLLKSPDALSVNLVVDPPEQRLIANLTINYDILNANKCFHCKYFLILPIFQASSTYNYLCYSCSKSDTYVSRCNAVNVESNPSKLLCTQNYPCRWINCDAVIKADKVVTHEVSCNFRLYRCMFNDCIELFNYGLAKEHYETHLLPVAEKVTESQISFEHDNHKYHQCVLIDNEIVLITYVVQPSPKGLLVSGKTTFHDKKKISIEIHFKHHHCKVETKTYVAQCGTELKILFSDFPTCFVPNENLRMRTTVKWSEK